MVENFLKYIFLKVRITYFTNDEKTVFYANVKRDFFFECNIGVMWL